MQTADKPGQKRIEVTLAKLGVTIYDGTTVLAYVNHGRWVADCACNGGELVAPDEMMLCGSCGARNTVTLMNTHVRDNLRETAPFLATAGSQLFVSTAANTLTARSFAGNGITTQQTTASTSFTDLASTGPTVTVTTGTNAIVIVNCEMSNATAGQEALADFAITGASARSASSATAITAVSSAADERYRIGVTQLFTTGVSAGSNTFQMKYRVTGGTGTFLNRRLVILPL